MCKEKLEYLTLIGQECKAFRESLGVPRKLVAEDLGCVVQNIYSFEKGTNNSALILLWYLSNGLDLGKII